MVLDNTLMSLSLTQRYWKIFPFVSQDFRAGLMSSVDVLVCVCVHFCLLVLCLFSNATLFCHILMPAITKLLSLQNKHISREVSKQIRKALCYMSWFLRHPNFFYFVYALLKQAMCLKINTFLIFFFCLGTKVIFTNV